MFRYSRYLTILFVLSLFVSCYSGEKEEKVIFHYNETTGIASIDPAFAKNQSIMWAIHQLYNTLVEVDSNLNIIPSLAKRWEISEDKKTYTFYLRNDVLFHDDVCFPSGKGRRMTAKDVAFSLQRIVNNSEAVNAVYLVVKNPGTGTSY